MGTIKQGEAVTDSFVNSLTSGNTSGTAGVFLATAMPGGIAGGCGAWETVPAPARESKRGTALATFRQNVEATIPALRRYARALTRDADTADDLVQHTLVRALRSEHLFHGGELRSWLYTILTNLNRNRLRSLARRPTLSPIEDNDAPELAGPEAGGRDIERALATLVEDQRNALLLVVLEGLSYREVAEVQGVPIGTVMSRLARARVQIKAYLDGERPALRRVK